MHWSSKYLGKKYIMGHYDCLDFVLDVLRAEYNIETYVIPNHGSCSLDQQRQLETRLGDYFTPLERPIDGCVVLLRRGKRLGHLGIHYFYNGCSYIIHNSALPGMVIQTLAYRIGRHGCSIESYFLFRCLE